MSEQPPPSDPWQPPAQAPAQAPAPAPPQAWGPAPGPWGPSAESWAPGSRRTNPWAITSLVTGVLPLFLVAVPAGIVALVQIHRRREAGTGLAVAGLVLGGLWTVVGGLLLLGFALSGPSGYLGSFAEAGATAVGQCLAEPRSDGSPYRVVDCSARHTAEVSLVEEFDDGPWVEEELRNGADEACLAAFEDYTGEDYYSSDQEYGFFIPDKAEWESGEQRFVCVITAGIDSDLRGSVRDRPVRALTGRGPSLQRYTAGGPVLDEDGQPVTDPVTGLLRHEEIPSQP